ncbi:N6-adenosine-specific RNA methylase IME4 [Bradyrhizobium brasilense]|uniref:N6-adenosine-specific RNA methylase IME4 n=1 Tax=Bradyrhizobium brasilense TaxID=1419277 RepID=A0A1G6YUF9_9BRAD|nr:MT-A70 family methyltransferase [Bradyrhizobium brasilense]SDD93988.1 N6-adenosine-specific RNA methylase IME4 [Bradyrhizobium brasilense]
MALEFHQYADLFPLVEGDAFEQLVEDVREHGIRDPITVHEGKVLDGRNRYRALAELIKTGEVLGKGWGHRANSVLDGDDLNPPHIWFVRYNAAFEGDALAWVISKNLIRRHMDESERAMVAADIGKLDHGGDRSKGQNCHLSTEQRARLLNISRRTVRSADWVKEQGVPELAQAVRDRKVAVSTAETIAHAPQDEQAAILAAAGGDEKAILAAAKSIRARDRRIRFDEVNEKLAEISKASQPLPTGQRFPIIYADPATRYVSGFGDRSIENHYPTMTIEELCVLPVSDLAMDRAVLFIWTTIPQLRNTMRIIEAWGFTYVSAWCWDKVDHGTGHWGFNQHEELLIATRGDFPAPVPGTQPRSLYSEKKTDHSVKPAYFAEQIEMIWPKLPKIELFARSPRPGWERWGNQADAPAPTPEIPDDDSEAA